MANNQKKRYGNWARNFGRSTMFASKEILTESAPSITESVTGIPEELRELKSTLRKINQNKVSIINYLLGEDENVSKYAKDFTKRIKTDWKTGKFYDPNREEKLAMKAFGMDDTDLDFGEGSDFDDDTGDAFDIDESSLDADLDGDSSSKPAKFSSIESGPAKIVNMTGPSTRSINEVTTSVNRNTEATVQGFNAINRSNKETFAVSMAISQKFHEDNLVKLNQVSEAIQSIVTFNNESLSPFVQGSLKYYDDSLKELQAINQRLAKAYPDKEERQAKEYEDQIGEVFDNGGFSLMGYAKLVAKNARRSFQDSPFGLISMLNDPMVLASFAANPYGFLLKSGIDKLIPDSIKTNLTKVDNTFREFFPALLSKIAGYDNNEGGFKSIAAQIFGIKLKKGYDRFAPEDFERGAISFDGETKKAITEVIPAYLSKIAFAVEALAYDKRVKGFREVDNYTGPEQMVFDWSNDSETGGRFTTANVIKARRQYKEREAKLSGFTDANYEIDDALSAIFGDDTSSIKNYKDKFQLLFEKSVDEDKAINVHDKNVNKLLERFFNETEAKVALSLLRSLSSEAQMQVYGSGRLQGINELSKLYHDRTAANRGTASASSLLSTYKGNVFNPITTARFGTEYYDGNERMGVYKNIDTGEWEISREDLKKYNKENNTEFSNAKAVIEHYIKHKKNPEASKDLKSAVDMAKMTDSEREKYIAKRIKKYQETEDETKDKDKGVLDHIKSIFDAPVEGINALLKRVDNTMYKIIFGVDENGKSDKKSKSIFGEIINGITALFSGLFDFLKDGILTPFKNFVFGNNFLSNIGSFFGDFLFGSADDLDEEGKRKGGVLSGVADFAKETKETISKGFQEDIKKAAEDSADAIKEYFLGKQDKPKTDEPEKEKKPLVERIGNTIGEGIDQFAALLTGHDPNDVNKSKAAGKKFSESFKQALPKVGKYATGGALLGTVSGLGGFGMLGSLFLPGGPIGGAIVGSAVAFASRSKKLQDILFGEITEETSIDANGNTVTKQVQKGGIIPKRVTDFAKKNKIAITVGGGLGGLTALMGGSVGFGLMPSVIVSAFGPVIAGSIWGLVTHSAALKAALFGKEELNPDGTVARKVGGLMNTESAKYMKKAMPRAVVGAGGFALGSMVLSQMGIIGGAMALGPFSSAILGSAFGFATASEAFSKRFFGYEDANGEYHSGVVDKLGNFLSVEAFKPMKLFFSKAFDKTGIWFQKGVINKISDSLFPIKLAMVKVGENITTKFGIVFKSFSDGMSQLFSAISTNTIKLFSTVLAPVRTIGSKVTGLFSRAVRSSVNLALLPLTFTGMLASGYIKGSAYKNAIKSSKDQFKTAWTTGGLGDIAKSGFNLLRSTVDTTYAYQNDEYAAALLERKEKTKERDRLLDEKLKRTNTFYEQQEKALAAERKALKENEYGLTDEQLADRRERLKRQGSQLQSIANADIKNPTIAIGTAQLDKTQELINESKRMNVTLAEIKDNTSETDNGEIITPAGTTVPRGKIYGLINGHQVVTNEKQKMFGLVGKRIMGIPGSNQEESQQAEAIRSDDDKVKNIRKNDNSAIIYAENERQRQEARELFTNQLIQTNLLARMVTIFSGKTPDGRKISNYTLSDPVKKALNVTSFAGMIKKSGSMYRGIVETVEALSSITNILGAIGLGVTALTFLFGDKTPGSGAERVTRSNAASYLGRHAAEKVTKGGLSLLNLGRAAYQTGSNFIKNGKNYYRAASNILNNKRQVMATGTRRLFGLTGEQAAEVAANNARKSHSIANAFRAKISKKLSSVTTSGSEKISTKALRKIESLLTAWIGDAIKSDTARKMITDPKSLSKISRGFLSLISFFCKPETFNKILDVMLTTPKGKRAMLRAGAQLATILGGATAATGVGAVVAAAGGAISAGFLAYDGITGLIDANKLFDVAPEDVTFKMRLVAAFVNMLFGYGMMAVVDVGLAMATMGLVSISSTLFGKFLTELGIDIANFDHRKLVAQWVYRLVSSDEDSNELDQKQNKLKEEYEKYLYDKGLNKSDMSLSEYQNKKDKGLFQTYVTPVLNRILGIDNGDPNSPKSFADLIFKPVQKLAKWFTDIVDKLSTQGIGYVFKSILGLPTSDTPETDNTPTALERFKNWFSSINFNKPIFGGGGVNLKGLLPTKSSKRDLLKEFNIPKFSGSGNIEEYEKDFRIGGEKNPLPYYWNQRAANVRDLPVAPNADKYFGNMGEYGCAPTSMAMVASMYNGYRIDPEDTSKFVLKSDLSYGDGFFGNSIKGIKESYFEHAAKSLGLNMYNLSDGEKDIRRELQQGRAVILGGRNYSPTPTADSPFTRTGHYVVIAGTTPDGKGGYVYDPLGRSGVYDLDKIFTESINNFGFAASFAEGNSRSKFDNSRDKSGKIKLLNLDKYGLSYKAENNTVDLENLSGKAKAAMDYIAKYFKSLTGRMMIVSSGYRTKGTTGPHKTGNCFDVVDDDKSTILEKNENGVRDKMIAEANRVGIYVYDEYIHDSPHKTGGHLHMDATGWLAAPAQSAGKAGKAANKLTGWSGFFAELAKGIAGVTAANIAGEAWVPDSKSGYTNGAPDGETPKVGETNADHKKVYRYLKDQGYNDIAIAAIMGNIQQESNFKGTDVGIHKVGKTVSGGIGLFQLNDERAENLKAFARERGLDYQDPGTQLAFFTHETKTSEPSGSVSVMNKFTSPAEAALHFANKFERCSSEHIGPRDTYANTFMERINRGEFAGAGGMNLIGPLLKTFERRNKPINISRPSIPGQNNMVKSTIKLPETSDMNLVELREIIRSVRALDTHAELREMIGYLKTIASSSGSGNAMGEILSDSTKRKITDIGKKVISKNRGPSISKSKLDTLMDMNNSVMDLSQDSYDLAYSIARGGQFRKI